MNRLLPLQPQPPVQLIGTPYLQPLPAPVDTHVQVYGAGYSSLFGQLNDAPWANRPPGSAPQRPITSATLRHVPRSRLISRAPSILAWFARGAARWSRLPNGHRARRLVQRDDRRGVIVGIDAARRTCRIQRRAVRAIVHTVVIRVGIEGVCSRRGFGGIRDAVAVHVVIRRAETQLDGQAVEDPVAVA